MSLTYFQAKKRLRLYNEMLKKSDETDEADQIPGTSIDKKVGDNEPLKGDELTKVPKSKDLTKNPEKTKAPSSDTNVDKMDKGDTAGDTTSVDKDSGISTKKK